MLLWLHWAIIVHIKCPESSNAAQILKKKTKYWKYKIQAKCVFKCRAKYRAIWLGQWLTQYLGNLIGAIEIMVGMFFLQFKIKHIFHGLDIFPDFLLFLKVWAELGASGHLIWTIMAQWSHRSLQKDCKAHIKITSLFNLRMQIFFIAKNGQSKSAWKSVFLARKSEHFLELKRLFLTNILQKLR